MTQPAGRDLFQRVTHRNAIVVSGCAHLAREVAANPGATGKILATMKILINGISPS